MGPQLINPDGAEHTFDNVNGRNAGKGQALGDHVKANDPLLQMSGAQHGPMQRYFQPYQNNGGTVVSVSGPGYTVVASDTRLGSGYTVPSRHVTRVMKLTNHAVLASSGMQSDIAVLHKMLRIRLTQYKHNHNREMTLSALSQMLSTILYYRRFQPYYTFNVLGGIDEVTGQGWSYSYDAIGSHEKVTAVVSGTGQSLFQPVLDNQVERRQMSEEKKASIDALTLQQCVDLIKDGFTSTCERDIYTGDSVDICKVTKDGVEIESFELRAD